MTGCSIGCPARSLRRIEGPRTANRWRHSYRSEEQLPSAFLISEAPERERALAVHPFGDERDVLSIGRPGWRVVVVVKVGVVLWMQGERRDMTAAEVEGPDAGSGQPLAIVELKPLRAREGDMPVVRRPGQRVGARVTAQLRVVRAGPDRPAPARAMRSSAPGLHPSQRAGISGREWSGETQFACRWKTTAG